MSDQAETAALGLLELLMQNDKMAVQLKDGPAGAAKRLLFSNYAECLRAVVVAKERALDPTENRAVGLVGEQAPDDSGSRGWSALPDPKG